MINESFEEQQKQTEIFENAVKSFLYTQARNKSTDNGDPCSNLNSSIGSINHGDGNGETGIVHRNSEGKVISVCHERMPYTASITASSNKQMTIKDIGNETSSISPGL